MRSRGRAIGRLVAGSLAAAGGAALVARGRLAEARLAEARASGARGPGAVETGAAETDVGAAGVGAAGVGAAETGGPDFDRPVAGWLGAGGRGGMLARTALGMAWPAPDPAALRAAVTGRTVLVTGASAGIGEATARRVAAAGGTVLIVARTADRLAAVRDGIRAAGGAAHDYPADLADVDQVGTLVDRLLAVHGGVDVVVNNAGKSIRRPLDDSYQRFHDYTRTINVNYLGPVRLLLGLLPGMRARGTGHVVNVSTVGVDLPVPAWTAYLASKSAFEAWLRAAAPEALADGVSTSSIHFPLVHTAMSAPTEAFSRLPGMTAGEAGDVVCRALAYRPRLLSPWWSRFGGLVGDAVPAALDAVLARYLHTVRG